MSAVSSVITSGIQQYNNFIAERLQKRKPIKKPLRKNKLHVFAQQRKAKSSSLTILRNGCSFFSRLYNCMERGPARIFSGTTTSHHQQEVLVDCTNTDYEETVHPVSDDIAIEELSDFISGTELESCTQEEEQLISKDTDAYLAADRSPEADVKILDGAFVVQIISPRTLNTFLRYIFGQLQSVRQLDIVWDVYLTDNLKAGTRSKRGQTVFGKVQPPYSYYDCTRGLKTETGRYTANI